MHRYLYCVVGFLTMSVAAPVRAGQVFLRKAVPRYALPATWQSPMVEKPHSHPNPPGSVKDPASLLGS